MSLCGNQKNCPVSSLPYVIQEGDTLYKIAESYNTTAEQIISANRDLNIYNLQPGRAICVPVPPARYPQCRTTNYYIAREGDTFFSIAEKFGVSLDELLASNIGVAPENIFDGIILCIPVAPPPVCLRIKSDGSRIELIDKKTDKVTAFPSSFSKGLIIPNIYYLTQKRLEAGSLEGAKELLFSPLALGIRGSAKMDGSSALFVETDNKSMLELFNSVPVGTRMEVFS